MAQEVHVRLKGSFGSINTHCATLKEAMETYPMLAKRSWIAEWWKEGVLYDNSLLTSREQMELFRN